MSRKSKASKLIGSAVALVATAMTASSSLAEIIYVTTETPSQGIGVFYRDAGQWSFAGSIGTSLGATYGITRGTAGELFVTESSTAGRLLRIDGTGNIVGSPLATQGVGGVGGSLNGAQLGPDGKLYFTTAFAGQTGIWRVNTDGSALTNVIPFNASNNPDTRVIRDITFRDADGDASNGFDLFFGSRNGFADVNRPVHRYSVSDAGTASFAETLTTAGTSVMPVYYDAPTNKVYFGRAGGGGNTFSTVNPTGTGQVPTGLGNLGDSGIDITRIGDTVVGFRLDGQSFVLGGTGTVGSVYANFNAISGGLINQARQVTVVQDSELPTVTWDGGAGDNNFSSALNYNGDTTPSFASTGFGPRIVFGASPRTTPVNDVANALVGNVAFAADAPAYTITGNGFTIGLAGGVTNASADTQTLSTNSAITLGGGSVNAVAADIVFNSDVILANGGRVTFGGAGDIVLNGKVSGAGNMDKVNTGALSLNNAANDYTGRLTISRGSLVIDSASSQSGLGAAGSTLSVGGGALDGKIELSNGVNVTKSISLTSRDAQAGVFLPQLLNTGSNNAVASVSLIGGGNSAVVESAAGQLAIGSITNGAAANGNVAVRFQGAGNFDVANIGGGASNGETAIVKAGTGTLTLSGFTNTGSGLPSVRSLTVLGGTARLNTPLPSSVTRPTSIVVNSGATLDVSSLSTYDLGLSQSLAGSGTILAGTLNAYEDNAIRPGNDSGSTTNNVGTLTIQGNLRLANDFNTPTGGLFYDLGSTPTVGGTVNDLIQVNGDLALASVNSTTGAIPLTLNFTDGSPASASYRLINYTGNGSGLSSDFRVIAPGDAVNFRQTFTVDTSTPGQVNLVVAGVGKVLDWKGDGAGVNDRFDVNTSANFLDAGTPSTFKQGDTVRLVDDATADKTINLFGNIIGRIEAVSNENYTLKTVLDYDTATAGNQSSNINGSTIVKSGSGTLTIDSAAAALTWTGQLIINSGVVTVTGNNGGLSSLPFGTGPTGYAQTVLDGGTLRFAGATGLSNRVMTLGANGGTIDVVATGAITLGAAANLVQQYTGTGSRSLTVTGTQNLTYGAVMNDPTGGTFSLIKNGGATLTLTGTGSTYGGALTVNSGRVTVTNLSALGSAAGATTVNNTGSLLIAAGTGSFTSGEAITLSGTGSQFGANPQETNGALRVGNANSNITLTAPVTLAADANIGVDDATASLRLTGGVNGAKLTKVSNGRLVIDTPLATVNSVTGLDVQAGRLDLVKSKIAINYTGDSPLADIAADVLSGRADGAWNGPGINSSSAAADSKLAIGYGEASDVGATSQWFGATTDATTVLLLTTLKGDASLDTVVNFTDLVRLAQNYNGTGKTWTQGDSNYDGTVNFADLVSLAQNYNQSLTAGQAALLADTAGSGFLGEFALAQAAVPEPTSLLAATALLGVGVLRRRR